MCPFIPQAKRLTATNMWVTSLLAVLRGVRFVVFAVSVVTGAAMAQEGAPAAAVPLRDGDRVVFVGDTFFEREGQRGFIETALVAAHPAATLRFRNLGWSGDTVWADSRGVFDGPAKGYARLLALVSELSPTIVFVAYGRNEAERGPEGIEPFRAQLAKLCGDLRGPAAGQGGDSGEGAAAAAAGRTGPRLVLVTPTPVETVDAAARNALLARYADAIRAVAAAEGIPLVDLFAVFSSRPPASGFTVNGIHLSDAGYAAAAEVFAQAAGGRLPESFAAQSADLRGLVVAKNTLFFHRWRPANETYIFLFRRHEQGNNAVEMPQFDPLVEEAERRVRAAVRGQDAPAADAGGDDGREAKR
jgi:lysophospholipase L1-like esterase